MAYSNFSFAVPSAPLNVRIAFSDATSVSLQWTPPSNTRGIIIKYTVNSILKFPCPISTTLCFRFSTQARSHTKDKETMKNF